MKSIMSSYYTLCWYIFFIPVFFNNALHLDSSTVFKNTGVKKTVYPKVLIRNDTESRYKRSANLNEHIDNNSSLYISLHPWTININRNNDFFISPNFVAEWIISDPREESKYSGYNNKKLHSCLPVQGSIEGIDNSTVALTICDKDIFGLINVSKQLFFLQPSDDKGRHLLYETTMPNGLRSMMKFRDVVMNNTANDHVKLKRHRRQSDGHGNAYNYFKTERPYRKVVNCFDRQRNKRALSICDTAEYYNMSRDVASPDYIQHLSDREGLKNDYLDDKSFFDPDYDVTQTKSLNLRKNSELRKVYPIFTSPTRVSIRWVKVIAGVDCDVIEFHGQRTEHYVFTILNIVSTLFKDISLLNILRIVVMKIFLYPDVRDSAIYAGDLNYPLYSVNKWNRQLWNDTEEKHDMAIWFTHFQVNEEVNISPGPHMCQSQWSCLLVEDVGWFSAIKIAHGIGHLIGLTHDGDIAVSNNCALEALLLTTIMSEVIPAVMPNPIWSSCSKAEYDISIKQYPCLERPPMGYEHREFFYGVFTLDEQCRIEFGDGWLYCSRISVTDPCAELWCNKNVGKRRNCMTRQTRTLEGTLCGRGKRCINQTCEEAKRQYEEFSTTRSPGIYLESNQSTSKYSPDSHDPPYSSTKKPTSYQPEYVPSYPTTTTTRSSYYLSSPSTPPDPDYLTSSTYAPDRNPDSFFTSSYRPGYPPEYPISSTYNSGYDPSHSESTYQPDYDSLYPMGSTHIPSFNVDSAFTSTSKFDYDPTEPPKRPQYDPNYPIPTAYKPQYGQEYSTSSEHGLEYDPGMHRPQYDRNYSTMAMYGSDYDSRYPITPTYRPGYDPNYPTVTYRPPHGSDYSSTTLYRPPYDPVTYKPPMYESTTLYRPGYYSPSHPSTATYRPQYDPSYPTTSAYRPHYDPIHSPTVNNGPSNGLDDMTATTFESSNGPGNATSTTFEPQYDLDYLPTTNEYEFSTEDYSSTTTLKTSQKPEYESTYATTMRTTVSSIVNFPLRPIMALPFGHKKLNYSINTSRIRGEDKMNITHNYSDFPDHSYADRIDHYKNLYRHNKFR